LPFQAHEDLQAVLDAAHSYDDEHSRSQGN
jgi:hypothetical protein